MTELAKPVAPKLVLTAAEQKTADELWKKKISELRDRDSKTKSGILELRYDIGVLCRDMFDNQRKWGGRTAKDLATQMGFSESTVYMCARFATTYTKAQLDEIKMKGLSWHIVPKLLGVQNVEERTQLEDKYSTGELTVEEVVAEVKSVNQKAKKKSEKAGEKVDNRGGVAPATVIKGVIATSDSLVGKLREYLSVLDELDDVEEGPRRDKLEELFQDSKASLKELMKQATKAEAKAAKVKF